MLKVFSVFDKKALMYAPLVCYRSEVEAKRAVTQAVSHGDSLLSDFPEDYAVYCFGSFDESTGKFTLADAPEFVVDVSELRKNYVNDISK